MQAVGTSISFDEVKARLGVLTSEAGHSPLVRVLGIRLYRI